MKNSIQIKDRTSQRSEINKIRRRIHKRIKDLDTKNANKVVESIETLNCDSHKMYNAVKKLKIGNNKKTVKGQDATGGFLVTDKDKSNGIKNWFKTMLHDNDRPQDEIMENKPLKNPIKCSEVRKARKKLKTNRSTGPDEIENELIKHSGQTFTEIYTKQIINCFSNGRYLEAISQGNLIPLPKPKKLVAYQTYVNCVTKWYEENAVFDNSK